MHPHKYRCVMKRGFYVLRGRKGLFKTSARPRFCKSRVLFSTPARSMGVENPISIYEIYAALTPSDSRGDSRKEGLFFNWKMSAFPENEGAFLNF